MYILAEGVVKEGNICACPVMPAKYITIDVGF